MAAPARTPPNRRRVIPCLPAPLEPHLRLSVPLVPAPTRRPLYPRVRPRQSQCAHTLRQGRARLRLCWLLHHRPELYARVLHAAPHPPHRDCVRHQGPRQAEQVHGAGLHGPVLWSLRALWSLGHEPQPRVVFQHDGHVRGLSPQDARGRIQSVLSPAGELLGTAGHCAAAYAGEAAQGFQGAGCAPHHHPLSDLAQLPLPLHIHGHCRVHHPRHIRLLPRGKPVPPSCHPNAN